MRTALLWLEESSLLTREENRVQTFPSSLRVTSTVQGREKLAKAGLTDSYRRQLLELLDTSILHLRHATQKLKDADHANALPEKIWRLVRSIAMDGRSEAGGQGSLGLRRLDAETVQLTLQRDWASLEKTARLRRDGAALLLAHLVASVPADTRGNDLLADTTFGKMHEVLRSDLTIRSAVKTPDKLLDRALLWLHEQEIIRLNKGRTVFRPAMTIRLPKERRGFLKAHFEPLQRHYDEQVLQIHVMAEYAQRALKAMSDAIRLAMEYFSLKQEEFLRQWLPDREKELRLQTTPES